MKQLTVNANKCNTGNRAKRKRFEISKDETRRTSRNDRLSDQENMSLAISHTDSKPNHELNFHNDQNRVLKG